MVATTDNDRWQLTLDTSGNYFSSLPMPNSSFLSLFYSDYYATNYSHQANPEAWHKSSIVYDRSGVRMLVGKCKDTQIRGVFALIAWIQSPSSWANFANSDFWTKEDRGSTCFSSSSWEGGVGGVG